MTMSLSSVAMVTQFLTKTDTKFDVCLTSFMSFMEGKTNENRMGGENRKKRRMKNEETKNEGKEKEKKRIE